MTPFDPPQVTTVLTTFVSSWLGAFIGLFTGLLSLFGIGTGV